jgi:MFS family permease
MSVLGILTLYMIPYMTSLGHDRSSAGMVVMLYTLASLTGRIPLGMLVDVFKKTFIIALTLAMMGVGLFLFWLINGNSPFWLILLFAIIFGLGVGGIMPLRPPLLAEYFGTRNFGTIFGITSIFSTIAMVVAPPVAGWIFDTYGNYKSVWLALIGFAVVAVILMLTMPASPGKTKQITS